MSNEPIQQILDRSNGGLEIIIKLCPEAADCVNGPKSHFKLRTNEQTASASIIRFKNGNYYVTDFGGDNFKGSAINLYGYLQNKDLKTSIRELAGQYLTDEGGKPKEFAKPIITKRSPTELEHKDWYHLEIRPELNQFELETMFSKNVIKRIQKLHTDVHKDWKWKLNEVCKLYACASLISYSYVSKAGEVITKTATENYPIYLFTGANDFKKIYEPKAGEKFPRFRTFGTQDKNYLWGYARVQKAYNDIYNAWENDTTETKGKAPKLDEIIICSGNGDSLNTAALGYFVVWQNSETANLPDKSYYEMRKMAKSVYNLPDIDSTGLKAAHKLSLKYLDLKTIELPAELRTKRDRKQKSAKDLRDYLDYYTYYDFDVLVKSALQYKFWDEKPALNKDKETKHIDYSFNPVRGHNFINKCGFHRLESKTNKDGYEYIQVVNNVVKIIKVKDIKAFINKFLRERFPEDQRLRNTFIRSKDLKDDGLDNLEFFRPDFKYYDKDYQYMVFQNMTWKVTPSEITHYKPGELPLMVWEDKVIPHNVTLLDRPWEITEAANADGSTTLDIKINRQDCLFFNYMINVSRVHWRKETETALEGKTDDEKKKYLEENKFNISGSNLTEDEILEQKQYLINKIYVFGYMLARYKDSSRPWAPFLMDHKIGVEGQSNGGSGKTIFASAVGHILKTVKMNGKNKSLTDDKHGFEEVTEQTEFILIDDLDKGYNLEPFFAMISTELTVNPKYTQRFSIPYELSPKIAFTTNYAVKDISQSAARRIIYSTFCDWYHDNGDGMFNEDRTPFTDFGKQLFRDFTEEEWMHFFNTSAYCLQFYMKHPRKLNPPMGNVQRRNLIGIMTEPFLAWADVYFSDKLDTLLSREEAFNDFNKATNQKWSTTQKFINAVEAWCKFYNYTLNPKELHNGGGRIIKKWPVKRPDGTTLTEIKKYKNNESREVAVTKSAELIYIKTIEGLVDVNKLKDVPDGDDQPPAAGENKIPEGNGIFG